MLPVSPTSLGSIIDVMCSMCMYTLRAVQVPSDMRQASHRPSRPAASSRRSRHSWTHTRLVTPRLALRMPLLLLLNRANLVAGWKA